MDNSSRSLPPLAVDLDGTLVRTDTLHEQLAQAVKRHPLQLPALISGITQGKARFKTAIAEKVEIDGALLPYNEEVLSYLRAEKAKGRKIILATAAHESIAHAVAAHLGLFDDVIATSADRNLKGDNKADALETAVGGTDFDYIGDSSADRAIWQRAGRALVVAPQQSAAQSLAGSAKLEKVFATEPAGLKTYLKAMRVHQWAKNVLLATPLFLSQQYTDPALWIPLIAAFVSFGLCASATYCWNDLLDLPADRAHATKRNRPFASGKISIRDGLVFSALCLLASFALAAALVGASFIFLLLGYIATTVSYSFLIKTKPVADVIVLGALYAYRIFAGGIAVGIEPSEWLLSFSMFFFVSLGFMKRMSDMHSDGPKNEKISGRGYFPEDRSVIQVFGVAAGYCAVIIMALYITDENVTALYRNPEFLWFVCLGLLYWISRTWILAARGHMPDDPVVFALKDKVSLLCGVFVVAAVLLAAGTLG